MGKPKIRFKGYEDDWEQRKLGEMIKEYKETVDSDCILPVLTSSKTEGVILQEEHFGRKQQHDITGYNILPRNYCTYRNRSDGVDFTFNINKCCDKGIISKFYPVFSGNNSDVFFISLLLNNSDEIVQEIAYTCTGTGQKVLSFLDLQKMKIKVPNFEEQKKIAAYFDHLDHLITLHQRKCEETKSLKKYMLQKMFPENGKCVPKIRFSGFSDDWEQRKLGELGSLKNGMNFSKDAMGHGFHFVNLQNIFGNNVVNVNALGLADATEKQLLEYTLIEGDVLFVRSSVKLEGVGEAALVPESLENTTYSGFIIRFRDEYGLNNDFKKYIFGTQKVRNQIMSQATNSANKNISQGVLENLTFEVPSFDEQAKIGEFFTNLDYLITLHQHKCDELQKLKKFMLQNMFV